MSLLHDGNLVIMNAQECRTLTATCMHIIYIAWLTACVHYCACSISGVLNYIYPTPEQGTSTIDYTYHAPKQGSGTQSVLFRVSDLELGEGTWLCHYINKLKASVTYFN